MTVVKAKHVDARLFHVVHMGVGVRAFLSHDRSIERIEQFEADSHVRVVGQWIHPVEFRVDHLEADLEEVVDFRELIEAVLLAASDRHPKFEVLQFAVEHIAAGWIVKFLIGGLNWGREGFRF